MTRISHFKTRERRTQGEYLDVTCPDSNGFRDSACRLDPSRRQLNLAPAIRDVAPRYMAEKGIAWHAHANHALSSQVCCLNFLMPLAEQPEALSEVIAKALAIDPPEMLEVENGPDGSPWYVAFEWIGRSDYLNEATKHGKRVRGANCTSADAVVRFRHRSRVETLLIEWKYTESYGQPLDAKGNAERTARYKEILLAPAGPIRSDLGLKLEDFFYEPFYQLARQQMLAFQMQEHREDGADRVHVLHISPGANLALKKVTSPALRRFGDNAFTAFKSLLICPDDFVVQATERLFDPALRNASDTWGTYLSTRYEFLKD